MKIKREEVKEIIFKNYSKRPDLKCFEYLKSLRSKEYEESESDIVFNKMKNFVKNFKSKFEDSKFGRKKDRFERVLHEWLQENEDFSIEPSRQSTSSGKFGRPEKKFEDLSEGSKFHVIANQLQSIKSSPEMFLQAAESAFRKEGKFEFARNVKTLRIAMKHNGSSFAKIKPEKTLSLLLTKNFSVHQYNDVRELATENGYKIFPSLYSMRKVKEECRPENIFYNELRCYVPMQKLLDHTSKRVVKTF
jgi:hypothetical protein